jgi:hypothetical protein
MRGCEMNVKVLVLAVVTLALLPGALPAQFARTYGGTNIETATGILPTADDGFLVIGTTLSFEAGVLRPCLIKLAPDGSLQWARSYVVAGLTSLASACQAPDGGTVLAGAGESPLVLMKTGASGEPLWQTVFSGASGSPARIFTTADGGYGLVGGIVSNDYNQAWVVKLGASGEVLWQRACGLGIDERGRCGTAAGDGGLVIAGLSGQNTAFAFGIGSVGELSWQKTYVAADFAFCDVVSIERFEGGFFIAGTLANGDGWGGQVDPHGFIYRIGEDGTFQWAKAFAGAWVRGGSATPDGGFVVTGRTAGDQAPNLFVMKFRPDGEIEWQNAFGGYYDEDVAAVVQTQAGDYAAAGTTLSFGAGQSDLLALRVSSEGVLGSCRFSVGSGFTLITPTVGEGIPVFTEEETAAAQEARSLESLDLSGLVETYQLCTDAKLLTISSSQGIGATATTPPLGTHTYAANESVTISAASPLTLSGSKYDFNQWQGDVFSSTNPLILTITDDMTIQPYYYPQYVPPDPEPPDPPAPEGCYIATAAFGTPLDPSVSLLREFRDRRLLTSAAGRSFVKAYYRWSPGAAKAISRSPVLRVLTRVLLIPFIAMAFLILKLGWVPVLLILAAAMAAAGRRTILKRRARQDPASGQLGTQY